MFPDQLRRNHPGILERFLSASRSHHRFFFFFFSCSWEEESFFFCHKTISNALFTRKALLVVYDGVYNLELRNQTMWVRVRAKMWAQKEGKKRAEKLTEDEKNLKTQATAHFFISDDFVLFFLRWEKSSKRSQNCLVTKQRARLLLYCPRIYPPNNKPRESCSDEEDNKDLRRILDDNLDEE